MRWRDRREDANRKPQTSFQAILATPYGQRHVGLAALDQPQRTDATLLDEMDVDARSRLQIPREERRQHVLDELWRGPDAQAAGLAAAHRASLLGELLDAGQQLVAPPQQALARARHSDPTPGALEEPHAQLQLEIVNLSPERRLRDAQPGGGPRECPRLHDGDEVA